MLRRRDTVQRPRQHQEVDANSDRNATAITCPTCRSRVFSSVRLYSLIAADSDNDDDDGGDDDGGDDDGGDDDANPRHEYTTTARQLHQSMQQNCSWCSTIGNAILTAAHLDYWTRHWEGSKSDGVSTSSEDDRVSNEDQEAQPGDDIGSMDSSDSSVSGSGVFEMSSLETDMQVHVKLESVQPTNFPEFNNGLLKVSASLLPAIVDSAAEEPPPLPSMTGEEQIEIIYEILPRSALEQQSPCDKTKNDGGGGPDAEPTWIQLGFRGLETCQRSHEKCHQDSAIFTPKRLIMVDPDPCIDVRVCELNHLTAPDPYIALSYVWGIAQDHVLTTDTLEAKCTSIDPKKLPRSIQDAIEATRALKISYLWVDSLCIIQDSDADKKVQLPQMGLIYRHAAITIVAARASSSLEGFLGSPKPPKFFVQPERFELKDGDGDGTDLVLGYRQIYKPSDDPINDRAWTLQERVLSTRLLVFANDGPKWICQEMTINPSSPSIQPSTSLVTWRRGLADDFESGDEFLAYARELWNKLRAEYSERRLSVASDKLAAIQGIVTEVSRETSWRYVHGLWREYFFLDLFWRRNRASRIERAGAVVIGGQGVGTYSPLPRVHGGCGTTGPPTWSWASVQDAVHGIEDLDDPPPPFHFKALEYSTEEDGFKHSGPLVPPRLVVEGKLVELSWKDAPAGDAETDGWLTVPDELLPEGYSESIIGEATLDVSGCGISNGNSVLCLAMGLVNYENRELKPVEGILIQPCPTCDSGIGYHRVGFFRIYSTSFFKTAEAEMLTIY